MRYHKELNVIKNEHNNYINNCIKNIINAIWAFKCYFILGGRQYNKVKAVKCLFSIDLCTCILKN